MKIKGLVYGVAINDVDYDVTITRTVNGKRKIVWRCPFHMRWHNMLMRCYSEAFHKRKPTYKDCYVCEEWKTFSNFKKWMEQQDWQGKQLDKDILVPENKEYGPKICIFVSNRLNNIIGRKCKGKQNKYPTGISLNTNSNRFQVACMHSIEDNQKYYIGTYDTIEEASNVYNKEKSKYIIKYANNLTSEHTSDIERTKEGLIRHAGLLLQ